MYYVLKFCIWYIGKYSDAIQRPENGANGLWNLLVFHLNTLHVLQHRSHQILAVQCLTKKSDPTFKNWFATWNASCWALAWKGRTESSSTGANLTNQLRP
jgi:hypothetical protein